MPIFRPDRTSATSKAGTPAAHDSRPNIATDLTSEAKLKVGSASWRRIALKEDEAVRIVAGDAPVEPAVVMITSRSHDDVLEYTHKFVTAYSRRRFRSGLVEPVSLATYELLGNALNYGSVLGEVAFQLIDSSRFVIVSVSNETVQVRIDMLCTHLERLNKDPESTFLDEMRRSVSGGITRPMLGLARLVHEAKLLLDVYVNGGRVTVRARAAA